MADTDNEEGLAGIINRFGSWVNELNYPLPVQNNWLNVASVILLVLFFKTGRNFILFIFKRTFNLLKMLPGPKTRQLLKRYINLGMFSFLQQQITVFSMLCRQYPPETKFIVLPMDMAFMGAGKIKKDYHTQMQELAAIKKGTRGSQILPFVFVDPRRMVNNPAFFDYDVINNKVVLKNCDIRDYIEGENFAGFKIYPALGYYPFDEKLLPLWKYAADKGLPIMTHCIRGTIYYRGKKKKAWDQHPVFEQDMGKGNPSLPLLLPQTKNVAFTANFTHPMNYLCLVERELLYEIVSRSKDKKLHEVFGYDKETGVMQYDLCHLKICLGHFGGDDEWKRYFELDRSNIADDLISKPTFGMNFLCTQAGIPSKAVTEQAWKNADWYTIICSMMLQYPGIYADLSYILHDGDGIYPLLKLTLQNPLLRERVLYGTDFYVVRNHKSDKNLRADLLSALSENEFDQIARVNPNAYLNNIPVCKRKTDNL